VGRAPEAGTSIDADSLDRHRVAPPWQDVD
jgi:hypothetical protein